MARVLRTIVAALALAACAAAVGTQPRHFEHHPAHADAAEAHKAQMQATKLVDIWVNDTVSTTGWIGLRIRKAANASSEPHSHGAVWYAAGYAEGSTIQERIYQHWVNTVKPTPGSTLAPEVATWIQQHIAFIQGRVAQFNTTDKWWKTVGLHMQMIQGLTDGYNSVAPAAEQLTFFDHFVHNFQYELDDINIVTKATKPEESYLYAPGGCSSYIKPLADDLTFTHTTWNNFNSMLRVYRDIDLTGLRITFSGYPGLIHSGDDWYMLSNNLTVVETTNLIFNNAIYDRNTVPETVSEFLRVMVAHYVGVDGNSWTNAFRRYNSGTYNNQYMVLNNNLYVPGTAAADLPDGLLWIVEQMPGMAPLADVTDVIRKQGYWASYNRPFFPETYNASGNLMMFEKYGEFFSHDNYVRANMIRRGNENVHSIADIQKLIRYNDFMHDPMSVCPGCANPDYSPYFAIASRGDLCPHNANTSFGTIGPTGLISPIKAFGAIDAKIFSYQRMRANFSALIVNGPTHEYLPPFRWSTSEVNGIAPARTLSHLGQNDLQQYDWIDTLSVVPNQ
jgi:hypothetical protein